MAPVITEAKRKSPDDGKAVAGPLSADELRKMDAYFRALNYLTVAPATHHQPAAAARIPLLRRGRCHHEPEGPP
jgi:hypothetical protein